MIKLPPHGAHQRIGLFGGSFNPAHDGHRQVALYAMKRLGLDYVWWLVTPQNPLKTSHDEQTFAERFDSAEAIARHPRFVVTDVERQMGSRFTAQTLRGLKARSKARFVWIMGADSLANLDRWHDWNEIAETVGLAVLARPGYALHALGSKAALRYQHKRIAGERPIVLAGKKTPRWAFISMPLRGESSTAIRADKARPYRVPHKFDK